MMVRNKEQLHAAIANEKQRRQQSNNRISDVKYELQKKRRELYLLKRSSVKESDAKGRIEINQANRLYICKRLRMLF